MARRGPSSGPVASTDCLVAPAFAKMFSGSMLLRRGPLRAACACSARTRLCGGVSIAGVNQGLQIANGAFQFFNEAKKKVTALSGGKKQLPDLHLQFLEPRIGLKKIPAGVHPLEYLRSLPELSGFDVGDAKMSYLCPKQHAPITITSAYDWEAVLGAEEPRHLQVSVPCNVVITQTCAD